MRLVVVCLGWGVAGSVWAGDTPAVLLYSSAQVDGEGIFLSQLAAGNPTNPLPHIRLSDAPPFGRVLLLSREQITAQLQKIAPDLLPLTWGGRTAFGLCVGHECYWGTRFSNN